MILHSSSPDDDDDGEEGGWKEEEEEEEEAEDKDDDDDDLDDDSHVSLFYLVYFQSDFHYIANVILKKKILIKNTPSECSRGSSRSELTLTWSAEKTRLDLKFLG